MSVQNYIELKARAEKQIQLTVCNGCDACWLRCAHDVPASWDEWDALQTHIAAAPEPERAHIAVVLAQDKTVDLGDDVTVQMCRYFDMNTHYCAVYAARPLVCRLLGHVEWMPCPIERVTSPLPTPDALALMQSYARFERRTFAEWEEMQEKGEREKEKA